MQVLSEYNCKRAQDKNMDQCVVVYISIAFTINLSVSCFVEVCLTNPTGRCQTRPAGCCPSGPGCDQGLAAGQYGGPGRAECQHGSQHLPSWGPRECPGHKLLGRPGRLHLKGKDLYGWCKTICHRDTHYIFCVYFLTQVFPLKLSTGEKKNAGVQ